jgi:negative regulator of replication initiation
MKRVRAVRRWDISDQVQHGEHALSAFCLVLTILLRIA